jgi:hypothetical protein
MARFIQSYQSASLEAFIASAFMPLRPRTLAALPDLNVVPVDSFGDAMRNGDGHLYEVELYCLPICCDGNYTDTLLLDVVEPSDNEGEDGVIIGRVSVVFRSLGIAENDGALLLSVARLG